MSDVLVTVTIRLEDHKEDRRSGVIPGPPYPLVFIDLMEDPLTRVRLIARTPEALGELADNLRSLADDLEAAQRPYVGDEDADRGVES